MSIPYNPAFLTFGITKSTGGQTKLVHIEIYVFHCSCLFFDGANVENRIQLHKYFYLLNY